MATTSAKNEKTDVGASVSPMHNKGTSAPIFGQLIEPIKAFCTASRPAWRHGRRNSMWTLTVEKCPHCAGRHIHGGGTDEVPILGHRVAHCVDGTGGGYFLSLATEGGAA